MAESRATMTCFQASFIRQLGGDVALYGCNPPMRFLSPSDDGTSRDIVESDLVAVIVSQPVEGIYRTMLFAAEFDDDAVSYGPGIGSRQFDAMLTAAEAFRLVGYRLDDPLEGKVVFSGAGSA